MTKFTRAVAVAFGLAALMFGWASLPTFTQIGFAQVLCNSEFSGPAIDGGFSAYVPRGGPSFSLTSNPGYARISVPASNVFDHWTFVDGAPQLRCTAPTGDFELTTRAKVTLPTTADLNYHVGLVVDFTQRDAIYWGDYRGNEIRMERSGIRPGISAGLGNPNADLELKITKVGSSYTFSYRATGSAEWIDRGVYSTEKTPKFVGVIVKTWSGVRVLAEFDYIHVRNL